MHNKPSLTLVTRLRSVFARSAFALAAIATAVSMTLASVAANGAELRIRIGSDVGNLDPARIFALENQSVAGHIYNGLVKYDQETNEILPDLATQWSVSDDGLTHTFQLRDGVMFHKEYGQLTSDDVKFSLERVLDPETKSRYLGQLAGVKAVEAPDPLTVNIILEQPNSGLLNKLTAFNQGWIVSRKAVTEIGDEAYAMQPIGTGPFIFDKWSAGNQVRIVANPDYFEGPPALDAVVFRIIKDETAAAIALENGEIDIFFALQSPPVIDRLKQASNITVLNRVANHTINLVLNQSVEPLGDVRVRKAIAHGINRQAIIDGYFKGTKAPGYSVITSSFPEYTESVPQYEYDPAKAKALLAEAGQEGFTLELTTLGLSPYDQLVVPIASDLEKVGINTSIQVLERGAYLQARGKGDIMTCITGIVGPPDPDSPLVSLYATKSFPPGMNTARYDQVDDLLANAASEQDSAKRIGIYQEIMAKTMEDVPVLPLYADQLFLAHTDKVQGLVQNSLFTLHTYSVSLK